MIIDKEPSLRDKVKHKITGMVGIVITKYKNEINQETFLDVRGVDINEINEKIFYNTPISNWEVIEECDE